MQKACLSPPIQLALVDSETSSVLAFAKLTVETLFDPGVFVESVVVRKDLRGQGLGRRIMEACEKICRQRGHKQLRLTTTDQEAFYTRLGYKVMFDGKGHQQSNDIATKSDPTSKILMFKDM